MSRPVSYRRASARGAGGPAGRAASAPVKRHSRAERATQIERLERRGLGTREIAAELGLARSTVNIYRRDPDGSRHRQRLERYRGRCRNCGTATSGSDGPGRAAEWCPRCAGKRRRSWTEERILAAIRAWAAETGSPPRVRDWSPAHAVDGNGGVRRYRSEPGRWPSASIVAVRFGSFRAALERAGLPVPAAAPESRRVWTRERISEAVRRWQRETGRSPRRSDWQHAADWHPAASTVYRVAGSWQRALEAAGLPRVGAEPRRA
jgi:hypothetical protein